LSTNEEAAGKVMAAMAPLPFAVGLLLGAPIVAREIEAGTAATVWALAASRGRWLAARSLPILAVILTLLAALAGSSELLWEIREPWEPSNRFSDAGLHGPVIVAKGVAAFGVALVSGALIGRVLPAVIIISVLCLGLQIGAETAKGIWMQAEAGSHIVAVGDPAGGIGANPFPGGVFVRIEWRTPDGKILTDEEALAQVPVGTEDPQEWLSENFHRIQAGVPGSRYPEWARLEIIGFTVIGVVAFFAAFPIVRYRRPS
jgi:hypothetical protein